jgi:uncharacterized membrane protein YesL
MGESIRPSVSVKDFPTNSLTHTESHLVVDAQLSSERIKNDLFIIRYIFIFSLLLIFLLLVYITSCHVIFKPKKMPNVRRMFILSSNAPYEAQYS